MSRQADQPEELLFTMPGKTSPGFTMVELLVVMVLISMVTALTIPAIRTTLFTDQLKGTARRLVGLVVEVSQDAVSRQSEYLLNFDLDSNTVWSSSGGSMDVTETEEEKGRRIEIPESVRIVDVSSAHGGKNTQGETTIYFSKKGYVDKTAIHLRSDDGRDMTIILSPFLGTTHFYDSYKELEDDADRF